MSAVRSGDLGDVEVVMLLCDAAQTMGGKLYILGGGWSRVPVSPVIPMALAVKINVPWHLANEQLPFRATLVGEDGGQVFLEGQPLQLEGQVEVGRPPGLRPGTPLDATLAVNFQAPLPPGRYRWEFWVGDELRASAGFEVIAASAPSPTPG